MKRLFTLLLLLASWPALATNVTYSTPGSYSFTVPSGVTSLSVSIWGGGMSGNTDGGPGPGGAGGGFCFIAIPVSPGGTVHILVGAGGVNAGDEVVGFNSWVNNSTNAQPTSSSNGCYGEGGGIHSNPFTTPSCGVLGSINHCGGVAVAAVGGCNSNSYPGTGGSGAAGAAGDGVAAGSPPAPGAGGSGGGGQGGEGSLAVSCSHSGVDGFAGFRPGGGGGGGSGGSPVGQGGDGGAGQVVLFYTPGASTGASQMFLTWPG